MSQCVRGHYSRYQIPTVNFPVYHLMMKWLVHSLARTASLQETYLQLKVQYFRTCVPVSERFDPRACSLPPFWPDSIGNDALVVRPSYTGQRVVWYWLLELPRWRMSPHRANGTHLLDYVFPTVNYPHMQLIFCSWYLTVEGYLAPCGETYTSSIPTYPTLKYWTV